MGCRCRKLEAEIAAAQRPVMPPPPPPPQADAAASVLDDMEAQLGRLSAVIRCQQAELDALRLQARCRCLMTFMMHLKVMMHGCHKGLKACAKGPAAHLRKLCTLLLLSCHMPGHPNGHLWTFK